MSEPRLETIGDYDTLKGEKKRVVWAVVVAGLIIGAIYAVTYNIYSEVDDSVKVEDSIKMVPLK